MALIRILVKEGVTGSFYVKNGADFRKSSLIDTTQDKMAIFAIWPNLVKYEFVLSGVNKTAFSGISTMYYII